MECNICGLGENVCTNCDLVKQITLANDCVGIDFIDNYKNIGFRTFKIADECVFVFGNDLIIHKKDGVLQVVAKVDSKLQRIWSDELENI